MELALVAAPVALPLLYLVWLALHGSLVELGLGLARANAGWLALRVALLASGATLVALAVGAPWAWLVARTDVPGRRFYRWLGPLPLAIPPYVLALVYVTTLAPGGLLHGSLAALFGQPTYTMWFPGIIYGPTGAAFVLGLATAPYVFLNVYAALQRMDTSLEDAARGLGHTPMKVFRRVTLPLLRPALLAGGLLAFVYAWVDFGVVQMLRARTFTTVLYTYLLAGMDLSRAAGLSLLLVGIVWSVIFLQHSALGGARYSHREGRPHQERYIALGRWRWWGALYLLIGASLTLFLPLAVLLYQALKLPPRTLASFLLKQAPYVWNSLGVAFVGSILALVLAGGIGWQAWRGRTGMLASVLLQSGYAVPGTVLGLALIGLSLAFFPSLYGTPLLLPLAYLVLFAAPTLQGVRAALLQVSPSMEEAVRALGYGPLTAALRVIGPLAWPGLAATWLLTFVLALRELAATLILRPAGMDTLPVRVWVHAMDSAAPDPRAAAAALLLVVLVGLPWLGLLLLSRTGKRHGVPDGVEWH